MDTAEKIRFAFGVFGVAVLHFVGSLFLAFVAGTTGGGFTKVLSTVLSFPASVLPGPDNVPPLLGWGVIVLTSLLWGFGLCWAARYFSHR